MIPLHPAARPATHPVGCSFRRLYILAFKRVFKSVLRVYNVCIMIINFAVRNHKRNSQMADVKKKVGDEFS